MFSPLYKTIVGSLGLIAAFCVPFIVTFNHLGPFIVIIAFFLSFSTSGMLLDGVIGLLKK